jgi:hypothetical protein
MKWLCVIALVAATAQAGSVKPVRGIDVIVREHPGNTSRTVTSDGDGVFTVSGLHGGSYTLTFSPCGHTQEKDQRSPKSNSVTRFVLENPDIKTISVQISRVTCAISETMPLRAMRTAQGTLDTVGSLPPDVFAAGVDIEVQISNEGVISGKIIAEN